MKKISVLLGSALVLGLSLTSCSDDSNGSSVTEEKMVGKWNFNTTKISSGGQSLPEEDYFGNETGCSKDYITLQENGTAIWGDYMGSSCDLGTTTGTWSLEGKEITLVGDGVTEVYKVNSVSGSKLKVTETFSEGGASISTVITFDKAE